jgi:serralysin
MEGGDGDDTLNGGADQDLLEGGNGNDALRGGGGNDTVRGGDGQDVIHGFAGKDTLEGGADADTLLGGENSDSLTGGAGQDTMSGEGGNDTFIFLAITDSAVGDGHDVITDFVAGADTMDVSDIDANSTGGTPDDAFTFLAGQGTAFTNTAGEIRFAFSGGNTLVQFDTNGDGVADMEIQLNGEIALTAADFVL